MNFFFLLVGFGICIGLMLAKFGTVIVADKSRHLTTNVQILNLVQNDRIRLLEPDKRESMGWGFGGNGSNYPPPFEKKFQQLQHKRV
jgi:hypothetical protein